MPENCLKQTVKLIDLGFCLGFFPIRTLFSTFAGFVRKKCIKVEEQHGNTKSGTR